MSRTPQDRLADIRDSAARAQRAVDALQRAAAAGNDDEEQIAFDALLYRLLVIGEAVKALPADLLVQEPNVPWSEIARLREARSTCRPGSSVLSPPPGRDRHSAGDADRGIVILSPVCIR